MTPLAIGSLVTKLTWIANELRAVTLDFWNYSSLMTRTAQGLLMQRQADGGDFHVTHVLPIEAIKMQISTGCLSIILRSLEKFVSVDTLRSLV